VVLFQDCAIIYAKHPECSLFRFAPFTYPSFQEFSAKAVANLAAAEEKARLAFYNLPDHMARSLQGYATNLRFDQQQNHEEILRQMEDLRAHNARLELMLLSSKPHGKTGEGCLFAIFCLSANEHIFPSS
jgi:hypothetical protein